MFWKKVFLRWGCADPLEASAVPSQAQGLGWCGWSDQEGLAGVSLCLCGICVSTRFPLFRASVCLHIPGALGVGCRACLSALSQFRELVSSGPRARLFSRSHQWVWGRAGRAGAGAGRRSREDRCAPPPLRLRVQHLLQQQPALRRQVGPWGVPAPRHLRCGAHTWGRHGVRVERSLRTYRPRLCGASSPSPGRSR